MQARVTIVTDDADALDGSTVAPGLGGLAGKLPRLSSHVQEVKPELTARVIPDDSWVKLEPIALTAASKEPPPPQSPRELTKAQKAGVMRWALGVRRPARGVRDLHGLPDRLTAMADSGDEGGSRLNLTALGVGAAGLTTVIAGLSTTGTIGRVIRNDPEVLAVALMLVLFGAAALAAAGLPLTSGYTEAVFSIIGLELTVAGLILGALAGALTAEQHPEEPSVTAKLTQADRHLTGTVKAGTLTAKSRVVVIVDGLRVVGEKGSRYRVNTLMQTYAGPDGEGNVNVPIDLTVPAGRFDAIGINSWTEPDPLREDDDAAATATPTSTATSTSTSTSGTTQEDDGERPENERSCRYDRRVSTDPTARARARIGCLILPLSPVPRRPRVTISWMGAGDEAARVEVSVLARNAPVPLYAGELACGEE